ncbi:S41 family peptidase [Nibrella saemangeumensis]|uniref:S41 family peptidase n=1 Tax=Nibrella saemangeumensis TaxID=1084526 RepID=A0ABP8MP88_9BACT
MKTNYILNTIFAFLLLSLSACNDLTLGPEPANNPETNFEQLWQQYDRLYGLFGAKKVDWPAVYQKYRPKVTNGMSDDAFYTLTTQVLDELNDGHVWLLAPGSPARRHDSGPDYQKGDFNLKLVRTTYLQEVREFSLAGDVQLVSGTLPGNIGYIHFRDFGQSRSFYEKAFEEALSALRDTKALIVDIRDHEGGDDRVSQYVAGRFASTRNLFMTSRLRNGPGHGDFTEPTEWYVAPTGSWQYTKPVALLTNRITESAGETFTLAMNQNASVTQIGDTTYGIFSEITRRELPNGWIFSVSVGDYRAADGKSYEGIGIAPEITVVNTPADIVAGKDKVLEKALAVLGQ